jgi:ATP-dependent Clp protease ATP-binding subunit ClpB
MQREIDDKLAKGLLAGEIRDGDTVLVGVGDDGLTVGRMEP